MELTKFHTTYKSASLRVNRAYNPIKDTDGYKVAQWMFMAEGAERGLAYIESRGGEYDRVVMAGLQYILQEYLDHPVTLEMFQEAKELFDMHVSPGVFNEEMWTHILNEYGGRLPIIIKALPEGTVVGVKQVMATIFVDDPKCISLLTYFEDVLLRVWAPITTATKSFHCKQVILKGAKISSVHSTENLFKEYHKPGIPSPLLFKLYDFGARGGSSRESVSLAGTGHTASWLGSDTIQAVELDFQHYACKCSAFTIAASEHSQTTVYGPDGESIVFDRMIVKLGHLSMFACVCDGFDLKRAVQKKWGQELLAKVKAMNAILVVRPDSGCPIETPIQVIEWLGEAFGYTVNSRGYKQLNDVLVIQGDAVTDVVIGKTIDRLHELKWSIDNLTWGSGGWLHQDHTRDTQRFAYKVCWMRINGVEYNISKDPITDPGKRSKAGIVTTVQMVDGEIKTLTELCEDVIYNPELLPGKELLEVVYDYGYVAKSYTKAQIRERLETYLQY
jgi:nicotinamide phosphoribosyltransferase